MIRYPNLVAALDGRDIDEIAGLAELAASIVQAWAEGWVAPLHLRGRLAAVLDVDVDVLFRLDDDLEPALPAGAGRYVTDPATLRIVDRLRGVA